MAMRCWQNLQLRNRNAIGPTSNAWSTKLVANVFNAFALLEAKDRKTWRAWLKKNHVSQKIILF